MTGASEWTGEKDAKCFIGRDALDFEASTLPLFLRDQAFPEF
jgi:hypothetical protein